MKGKVDPLQDLFLPDEILHRFCQDLHQNILKKAEGEIQAQVNEALLVEQAEKDLYAALQTVAPKAQQQFESGDYKASLQTLAALRTPVDAFFEHVMVNAEDVALKANRLGLLATLHAAMNRVADLAKLVG